MEKEELKELIEIADKIKDLFKTEEENEALLLAKIVNLLMLSIIESALSINRFKAWFDFLNECHNQGISCEDSFKLMRTLANSGIGGSVKICKTFLPHSDSTSATKCKFCGRESWQH